MADLVEHTLDLADLEEAKAQCARRLGEKIRDALEAALDAAVEAARSET